MIKVYGSTDNKDTEYKTCDRCCYDILDDDGDIMEHVCINNDLY